MAEKTLDLHPVGTRIIVQTELGKQKSGLIHIPDSVDTTYATEGTVLAVGDECSIITVGQQVCYGRYAGAQLKRNEERFIIMDETDVLAIVK